MSNSLDTTMPPPQLPFVHEDLTLTRQGFYFLLALFNRTGGLTPIVPVDFQRQIDALFIEETTHDLEFPQAPVSFPVLFADTFTDISQSSSQSASSNTFLSALAAGDVADSAAFPAGPAGGDLSGTYPNPTVAKIKGAALGTTTATSPNILIADGSAWQSKAMAGDATIANTGTLTLASTAVTPASYGSATQSPTYTVDAKGRLTAAANVTITGTAPGGSAGGYLSGTYPNPNVAKVLGVSTNSNAAAGDVGEYISSSVLVGSAVALTSGVATDITTISLTAGDWDVQGAVAFSFAGAATSAAAVLNTSAALPTVGAENNITQTVGAPGNGTILNVGSMRFSLASTTTIHLVGDAVSGAAIGGYGFIGARRVR